MSSGNFEAVVFTNVYWQIVKNAENTAPKLTIEIVSPGYKIVGESISISL